MEDSNQENKQCTSRYRSPTFSKEEINALLNLIEKYKLFILNKSITAAVCQAKETTWSKIAKEFNSLELGHIRNADSLRVKWENLKRDARKLSKNVMDSSCNDLDAAEARVVAMISEADNISAIDTPQDILDDEDNINGIDEQKDSSNSFAKYWDEGVESEEGDEHERNSRITRSLNFSPQECGLLLQCVKKEKKHVFSKDLSSKAIELKNDAWFRIANSYNKLSPQKRSAKVLRTKFGNMKTMAKKVGFKDYFKDLKRRKHEKFGDDNSKDIKKEPLFEDKMNADFDDYNNHESDNDVQYNGHKPNNYVEVPHDPLSSVLNGDSGIGSTHMGSLQWNYSEHKEVVKLKMELLNYQLETAKLERKRIEEAMQEESSARAARATETALRLRAARLEAVAAAARLPPRHPALHFPPSEARAQLYLDQYLTINT